MKQFKIEIDIGCATILLIFGAACGLVGAWFW